MLLTSSAKSAYWRWGFKHAINGDILVSVNFNIWATGNIDPRQVGQKLGKSWIPHEWNTKLSIQFREIVPPSNVWVSVLCKRVQSSHKVLSLYLVSCFILRRQIILQIRRDDVKWNELGNITYLHLLIQYQFRQSQPVSVVSVHVGDISYLCPARVSVTHCF